MTPINVTSRKSFAPAIVPWVVGIAILVFLFAFPHDVKSIAAAVSPPAATAAPVALPAALAPAVVARFRTLPRVRIGEAHSIDTATTAGTSVLLANATPTIHVPRGAVVSITGWAADRDDHAASSAVFAIVGGPIFATKTGIVRDDVAVALASPAYAPSGFQLDIDTSHLPLGRSLATFFGVDAPGKRSYDLERSITLDITSS